MRRTFVLGGRKIALQALSPDLDAAFERLHAAHYGNTPVAWDEFGAAASAYFDAHVGDGTAHDHYFNNFTIVWREFLGNGRYDLAEHIWSRALQPALDWETRTGNRLHKGTPYYFWAMTVIRRGDVDRGYLLAHKALQEDVDSSGRDTPDTPGYALVSLNYERVDQAFREWVVKQARYLDTLLLDYNETHVRNLTIQSVRARFLTQPPSTDTLFLFTYTLARLMNISDMPSHAKTNAFAGQLEINILFDLTLVIDATIKDKNRTRWKFIHHAERLLAAAGAQLTNQDLRDVNTAFENDFDGTLTAALDGTLSPPAGALSRLQCDVAMAYGIRNFGAHNTGTAPAVYNRFDEVQRTLFRVLFAAVEHLY